jgi:hypothetical protein
MSERIDWMPGSRIKQLELSHHWQNVAKANAAAWGIPLRAFAELDQLTQEAEAALALVEDDNTHTPVATANCKAAFVELAKKMRDIKRRYFLAPPLEDADFASLGLKPNRYHPIPYWNPQDSDNGEDLSGGPA